jgi:hypothetical protein
MKNFSDPIGIEHVTFQLVALCLNQLQYCIPPDIVSFIICTPLHVMRVIKSGECNGWRMYHAWGWKDKCIQGTVGNSDGISLLIRTGHR